MPAGKTRLLAAGSAEIREGPPSPPFEKAPPGRALRICSEPEHPPRAEWPSAVTRSLADFLSVDATGEIVATPFEQVVLDFDLGMACPFLTLAAATSHLGDSGAVLYRRSESDGEPTHRHGRGYYFAALADHYGFSPAPAGAGRFAVLCRNGLPRWRIAAPAPYPLCNELFRLAFGTEISPALWEWKYGNGRGCSVMALRGERIIAHYAGTSRRVAVMDADVNALQVCDVMVDPTERGVMTRSGAFFQVASAWLEAYFGFHTTHDLAFGFPNRRAMRLGEKLGLYAEVARVAELNWTPLDPKAGIATRAVLLARERDHTPLFATLWRRMRNDLADRVAIIRDAAYLQYRYLENPQFRYDLLAVEHRWTGRPVALVVLRRETDRCRLLDYVGPLHEIPRALAHARRMVGRWGLPCLTGWTSARDADLFTASGASATLTDVCVPCNAWSEGPPADDLRDRWWLMMGDTEFL